MFTGKTKCAAKSSTLPQWRTIALRSREARKEPKKIQVAINDEYLLSLGSIQMPFIVTHRMEQFLSPMPDESASSELEKNV